MFTEEHGELALIWSAYSWYGCEHIKNRIQSPVRNRQRILIQSMNFTVYLTAEFAVTVTSALWLVAHFSFCSRSPGSYETRHDFLPEGPPCQSFLCLSARAERTQKWRKQRKTEQLRARQESVITAHLKTCTVKFHRIFGMSSSITSVTGLLSSMRAWMRLREKSWRQSLSVSGIWTVIGKSTTTINIWNRLRMNTRRRDPGVGGSPSRRKVPGFLQPVLGCFFCRWWRQWR